MVSRPDRPPWRVLVLTDRGLDASWLFRVLRRLGWPPGMRITRRNRFRPAGWVHDQPVWFFAARGGGRWQGRGVAFPTSKSPLRGTLGAWWAEGDEEGWYIVTALPPQAADAAWSGLRMGIEHGFAHFKSGGWPWQTTRMTAPDRVRRMWLALAVATLWVLSIGGPHDRAESPRETMPELATRGGASPPQGPHCPRQKQRLVSVLRQGMAWLWALLITGQSVLPGPWYPESWPEIAIIIQGRAHEE